MGMTEVYVSGALYIYFYVISFFDCLVMTLQKHIIVIFFY